MKKKILVSLLAVSALMLTACNAKSNNNSNKISLKTKNEKLSYSIGYNIGQSITKRMDIMVPNIDNKALQAGVTVGVASEKPKLTPKEMKAILATYRTKMLNKQKEDSAKHAKVSGKNLIASNEYIAKISKESGVKKLEKGLYYKVIKQGTGLVPTADDTVSVNYYGKLNNGHTFDSSYKRGSSATFKVNQVIPGWTKALEHMPVGSTWMLYISPDLAYGTNAPASIGTNQSLTFKVNLISIKK